MWTAKTYRDTNYIKVLTNEIKERVKNEENWKKFNDKNNARDRKGSSYLWWRTKLETSLTTRDDKKNRERLSYSRTQQSLNTKEHWQELTELEESPIIRSMIETKVGYCTVQIIMSSLYFGT